MEVLNQLASLQTHQQDNVKLIESKGHNRENDMVIITTINSNKTFMREEYFGIALQEFIKYMTEIMEFTDLKPIHQECYEASCLIYWRALQFIIMNGVSSLKDIAKSIADENYDACMKSTNKDKFVTLLLYLGSYNDKWDCYSCSLSMLFCNGSKDS